MFNGKLSEYFVFAEEFLRKIDVTQHFLGNMLIEIQGNEASVETYVLAYHGATIDGQKRSFGGGARYLDKLEKRDDEWRLLTRVLLVDWSKNITDDPLWNVDPIEANFLVGERKPNDKSMLHFKHIGAVRT